MISLSYGERTNAIQREFNQEIVCAGDTVHMVWAATVHEDYWKLSPTNRLYYRRSLDRGATWQDAVLLDESTQLVQLDQLGQRMLAVDGQSVHVVSVRSTGGGDWYYTLDYFRSTDNGATFAKRDFRASDNVWHMAHPFVLAQNGVVQIYYDYRPNWYTRGLIMRMKSTDNGGSFSATPVTDAPQAVELCDAIQQGDDVLLAFLTGYNMPGSYAWSYNMNTAVSTNRGESFVVARSINGKASHGHGIADGPNDYHEKPEIAKSGSNVYLVWTGLETNDARQVFIARSTDAGATFEPQVNLSRLLPAGTPPPFHGHATVSARGRHVYVTCTMENSRVIYWYSSNGGGSFKAAELTPATGTTTAGGWWPLVMVDPTVADGSRVHFFMTPGLYARSDDGGATLIGPAHYAPVQSWASTFPKNPQWTIDANGAVHLTFSGAFVQYAQGYLYTDADIFYRRIDPQRPPVGSRNRAISLWASREQARWDNIQVPDTTALAVSNQFTVEAWVKYTAEATHDTTVLYRESAAHHLGSIVLQTHSWAGQRRPSAKLKTADSFMEIHGGEAIVSNEWFHFALTYDAAAGKDNVRLYVNGRLSAAGTATGPVRQGSGLFWIGKSTSPYNLFIGAIDEVRLWNRCLTRTELAASLGGPRRGDEPGLLFYLPFDDSTRDLTAGAHDGVATYFERYENGFRRTPAFVSAPLTSACVGRPFAWQVTADFATGLTATGLPPGLACDTTTGLIQGTPTTVGVFDASIVETNFQESAQQILRIVVNSADRVVFRDDFNGGLTAPWNVLRADSAFYEFEPGLMTLRGNYGDTYAQYNRDVNLFAYNHTAQGDFIATLSVARYEPDAVNWNRVVLTAWNDTDNYVRFAYGYGNGRGLELISEKNGVVYGVGEPFDFLNGPFLLRLTKETLNDQARYVCAYSTNGVDFIPVSKLTGTNTPLPAALGFWLGIDSQMNNHAWVDAFEVRTIPSANTYERWAFDRGLAGPSAEPTACMAEDGIRNIVKYAFGIEPSASAAGKLPTYQVSDGNSLILSYRQRAGGAGTPGIDYRAGGLTYVIQAANELTGTWQSGKAVAELVPGGRTDNGDGTETVRVRVTLPPDAAQRFVRLALSPHP